MEQEPGGKQMVPDLTGTTVGRFLIRERLGAGGMGEVYRADDTRLHRTVALKRMAPQLRNDERFRRRFQAEAEKVSAFADPHVAALYDVLDEGGEIFLVMEYVEGVTLRQRLEQPISVREFLEIGVQCAEGLEAAHAKGIIHYDIKPENIMLTPKSQVKICDFGVAGHLPATDQSSPTQSVASQIGAFRGTPLYMAPEVLLEEEADGRADMFSLGVVFYEALTGRHPFATTSFVATADRILHEPPVPAARLNPRVSPELERILTKMLAKDRSHRYATASDLRVDLRCLMDPSLPVPARPASRWRWKPVALAAGVVAVLLAVAIGMNVRGSRTWLSGLFGPPRIESLAVLPLANLTGDPAQDPFCDGMTDELTANLSKIGALHVISPTSGIGYKRPARPMPEIGRDLGVQAVVEGSVQRFGDRVKVTAQLIYAPTGAYLWAETYERSTSDVLALQSELASAIAAAIRVKLTPQEKTRLASSRPVNPAAYEAYVNGRYYWHKREREANKKSLEYFVQAIELDPTYAPAYAGLSDYYSTWSDLPPNQAMVRAKEYALKAVELDDTLAEAHTALAFCHFQGDWDWPAAERELRRALELNHSDVEAHRRYWSFLSVMGRPGEALAEIQQAQKLDPVSIPVNVTVGWAYYFARHNQQAIDQCRKALDLDPNSAGAHDCLGMAYIGQGQFENAVGESQKAVNFSGGEPSRLANLVRAYAAAGRKAEAQKAVAELQAQSRQVYVSPYLLALTSTALGEKERAFAELEKAYQDRSGQLVWVKSEPGFDGLRSDPRFQDLLRRIGLPQ